MSPNHFFLELDFDFSFRKEAIKAVLHTILFQRVFGTVRPRESQVLDLSYCIVDDDELIRTVDSRVEEALRRFETKEPRSRIMMSIEFSEKKLIKTWFSTTQEEVCWEKWHLMVPNVATSQNASFDQLALNGRQLLTKQIAGIIDLVNTHKEHIPPITSKDKFAFPYKINVASVSSSEWTLALKKVLPSKPLLI